MSSSVYNNNRRLPDSDVAAASTVIDLSVKRVYIPHEFYKCFFMCKFSFKSE